MIEFKNVSKTYHLKGADVGAVRDVSLTIPDGKIYGVIGYSGAGKSTLIRCVNMLEVPDSGTITVNGKTLCKTDENGKFTTVDIKTLNAARHKIGMIFQHFNLFDRLTVFENVAFPLKHSGKSREEIRVKVLNLLKLVDLTEKANVYPSQLSGGQKQRVAIARALANDPEVLLSDEATSALDPEATSAILTLLRDLNRKLGLTVVIVTHEMAVIKQICDRVAVMENGRVVEEGSVYDVFSTPRESVTKRFVSSTNGLQMAGKLIEEGSRLIESDKSNVLVKLTYGKDVTGDALISRIARDCDVDVSIILANVEIIQDLPLGQTVDLIMGETENINRALECFSSQGVKVEVLKDGRIN
jgi:ABC-type metal ion transport system, ATPase component